ncbi:MAG: hypothetical protein KDJ16_09735 [Hyphomicrobiales bacterium]|nr:hypothetical protein [Hyphomicrobiales bacterium]
MISGPPPERDVVIILADPNDIHARAVAAEVIGTFGARAIILETGEYPVQWQITSTIDRETGAHWQIQSGELVARSNDVSGVWRRRSSPHVIHDDITDTEARQYCEKDAMHAFQGWLFSMGNAVINPFAAEFAASRKAFQLSKANEVGLRIPETVITNDPAEAREAIDRMDGRIIFKVLSGPDERLIETRRFRKSYKRLLANLRYAPVIFQELIDVDRDLRVTIVDDAVFPVSVKARAKTAHLDWRLDPAPEIRPYPLPKDVEQKLIDLLRALGLRFGALDLRLTPDGEYVFLEVNPAGQFLFCEIHGQQPISRALAAALLGRQ